MTEPPTSPEEDQEREEREMSEWMSLPVPPLGADATERIVGALDRRGHPRASDRWLFVASAAAAVVLLVVFLKPWAGGDTHRGAAAPQEQQQELMALMSPRFPVEFVPSNRLPGSPRFIPLFWRLAMAQTAFVARYEMHDGAPTLVPERTLKGLVDPSFFEADRGRPLELEARPLELEADMFALEEGDRMLLILGTGIGEDSRPRYRLEHGSGIRGGFVLDGGETRCFDVGLYDLSLERKVKMIPDDDLLVRVGNLARQAATIDGLDRRVAASHKFDDEAGEDLYFLALATIGGEEARRRLRAVLDVSKIGEDGEQARQTDAARALAQRGTAENVALLQAYWGELHEQVGAQSAMEVQRMILPVFPYGGVLDLDAASAFFAFIEDRLAHPGLRKDWHAKRNVLRKRLAARED